MNRPIRKVGRNETCTCGSGYKYKKCCLLKTAPITKNAIKASETRLKQRCQKTLGGRATFLLDDPKIKMSEVILDLAKNFLDEADTPDEFENIIAFTCTAWNLAVLRPPEEYETEISHFIQVMKLENIRQEVQECIRIIIDRKNELYPDINRSIIDYEFIGKRPDFHLNVMSALSENEILDYVD